MRIVVVSPGSGMNLSSHVGHDQCPNCRGQKCTVASLCLACYKAHTASSSEANLACPICGKKKSTTRVEMCRSCRNSMPRPTMPRLTRQCSCGVLIGRASKRCRKCYWNSLRNLERRCAKCGSNGPFYGKTHAYCIVCDRERSKQYWHLGGKAIKDKGRAREAEARYRARNRERESKRGCAWAKSNPEKARQRDLRNRARRRGAHGEFSVRQFAALTEILGGKCLCCGSRSGLHADHVKPISRGGSNSIENIQPLCKRCNSSKSTKTIDFRVGRFIRWTAL